MKCARSGSNDRSPVRGMRSAELRHLLQRCGWRNDGEQRIQRLPVELLGLRTPSHAAAVRHGRGVLAIAIEEARRGGRKPPQYLRTVQPQPCRTTSRHPLRIATSLRKISGLGVPASAASIASAADALVTQSRTLGTLSPSGSGCS